MENCTKWWKKDLQFIGIEEGVAQAISEEIIRVGITPSLKERFPDWIDCNSAGVWAVTPWSRLSLKLR